MNWNVDKVRNALQGQRILLIEDDNELASRLAKVFQMWGAQGTVRKRCMAGDTWGGLNSLLKEGDTFDLVCMDAMLPADENALHECDDLQTQLELLREQLGEIRNQQSGTPLSDEDQQKVDVLRARHDKLSRDLRERIVRDAGVTIINKWCEKMKEESGPSWIPRAGSLFLTARQEQSPAEEIKDFRKGIRWITKPASESQIGTAAAELLTGRR